MYIYTVVSYTVFAQIVVFANDMTDRFVTITTCYSIESAILLL